MNKLLCHIIMPLNKKSKKYWKGKGSLMRNSIRINLMSPSTIVCRKSSGSHISILIECTNKLKTILIHKSNIKTHSFSLTRAMCQTSMNKWQQIGNLAILKIE